MDKNSTISIFFCQKCRKKTLAGALRQKWGKKFFTQPWFEPKYLYQNKQCVRLQKNTTRQTPLNLPNFKNVLQKWKTARQHIILPKQRKIWESQTFIYILNLWHSNPFSFVDQCLCYVNISWYELFLFTICSHLICMFIHGKTCLDGYLTKKMGIFALLYVHIVNYFLLMISCEPLGRGKS